MFTSLHFLALSFFIGFCHCQCHKAPPDFYKSLGKKTVYENPDEEILKKVTHLQDCKPVRLWVLARHGARYPGKDELEKIEHLLEFRDAIVFNHNILKRGDLCEEQVEALKRWTLDVTFDKEYELTDQGRVDHIKLVERLKHTFPEIFPHNLNRSNYEFHHSGKMRAWQTTETFIKAFFPDAKNATSYATDSSNIVMPYDECTPWVDALHKKKNKAFMKGPEMEKTAQQISRRLGFKFRVTTEIITRAYEMCRYDLSWNVTRAWSPWCNIFSEEEFLVLEYEEDLTTYIEAGYGMENTTKLGCVPFKNLVKRYEDLENVEDNITPLGLFYFTHSTMMTMNIVSLELAHGDIPLTDYNYQQMANRKWRMSTLLPFSANFIIPFYKCSGSGERNRVLIMLNEKPIQLNIDGCSTQGVCSWTAFKSFIENKDCDVSWCKS